MNRLTLNVSQVIKADRAKVFRAWIEPELMKKWFAPGAMTVPEARSDPRPGGSYTVVMKNDEGTPTVSGEYQEVVANERLVFTWRWAGDDSEPTLVTVTFADVPGGTEVAIRHEKFLTETSRDRHGEGWRGCLGNLAARIGAPS